MEQREYTAMYEVEDTHFWYRGMRMITQSLLDLFLPKKKGNAILDAGCGTGGSFAQLEAFGTPDGIDISAVAVQLCKKRGIKNVVKGTIQKMPYKDSSFDLVTSFDVLYHKEVESDRLAIKEMYRVLKPGGVVLIRLPAYNWLYSYHDQMVHARHRYTRGEIVSLLQTEHFSILKATYANFFLFPLIILKRFLPAAKNSDTSDVTPVSPQLNSLLYTFFVCESFLIKYCSLPFGLSIVVMAKKE